MVQQFYFWVFIIYFAYNFVTWGHKENDGKSWNVFPIMNMAEDEEHLSFCFLKQCPWKDQETTQWSLGAYETSVPCMILIDICSLPPLIQPAPPLLVSSSTVIQT